MTEEIKENIESKIVGGYVGKYAISVKNKLYSFEFPIENKLEDNLEVVLYLKDVIDQAIENQKNKDKEEKK